MTRLIRFALAAVTAAAPLAAQVRTADPVKRGLQLSQFPRLVRLTPRVYGYEEIRQPGFTTVSLIVIGDRGVLIADGQGSSQATQTMLDSIKRLTPLPVRWYVVGSDHGDHTAGNSVLPKDITYIVHPTSRAQLVRDSASATGRGGQPPRVVVVPPTAMTSDKQTVDVGGAKVDVMFLGRAHTGGDLSVYLPNDKILFMSEAYLNRVFPAMRSAYPMEWIGTIDKALALDVRRFVPGHGFIEEPAVSREELITFKGALVAVIDEVKRLHALGLSADDAVKQANWGQYKEWFLAEQQAPIAVRRVYDEIEGKLPSVQYRSPAGVEYFSQPDTGAVARAKKALDAEPKNIQRFVDLGVAQSGVRQFREAIETFTRGLAVEPNNALLYRWRGHRYLSLRQFDKAKADLERGAKLDSTIYGIWYHLGIVRFVQGDFAGAADAFKRGQPRAPDAGELAGSTDWLWMSLMRAGRAAEAKAMLDRHPDSLATTIAYAKRLKLYRGEIGPNEVFTPADTADVQVATLAYGLGNWYLVRGEKAKAREWFEKSIASGGWPGFGFIMSEVELRRVK
jgi:cyclase